MANFASDTGYAWGFIEALYAAVADRLAVRGVRTWVAYPHLGGEPATLRGHAAAAVELALDLDSPRELGRLLAFVRRNHVRALYLTGRPTFHPAYALLRAAGVRWIVVHDHASGSRGPGGPLKRALKRWTRRIRPLTPDVVIGVSEFVGARLHAADQLPLSRIHVIHNALPSLERPREARALLHDSFGVARERPIVFCASRASQVKGIAQLMRAFDRLVAGWPWEARPFLVHVGDGPALAELRRLHAGLSAREDMVLAGYRADAAQLAAGAHVCVVPSLWQEAFGLAALEAMMQRVPVIATWAGGLPEVVRDGESGILVPPGDEAELEGALFRLLRNPRERARLARNGRRRAERYFSWERTVERITAVVAGEWIHRSAARGLEQVAPERRRVPA